MMQHLSFKKVYLVLSCVKLGRTFLNTAWTQFRFIPAVIAHSVYTPSVVCESGHSFYHRTFKDFFGLKRFPTAVTPVSLLKMLDDFVIFLENLQGCDKFGFLHICHTLMFNIKQVFLEINDHHLKTAFNISSTYLGLILKFV